MSNYTLVKTVPFDPERVASGPFEAQIEKLSEGQSVTLHRHDAETVLELLAELDIEFDAFAVEFVCELCIRYGVVTPVDGSRSFELEEEGRSTVSTYPVCPSCFDQLDRG